jgi:uncharacterized membrane protein (UPF0127 family)
MEVCVKAADGIHVFWKSGMSPNSFHPVNKFGDFSSAARALFLGILLAAATFTSPAQTQAQPELPITKLSIGGKSIRAEIADEEHERAAGLMFRKELADDAGMLFIMPQTGPVAFWMRNTEVPLTIAYIGPNGAIMELHDLEPFNERPVPSSFPHIAYALEMPRGWFTKNNIWPGERVVGLPKSGGK